MKIEILRETRTRGEKVIAGQKLDIDDDEAIRLINRNKAKAIIEVEKPKGPLTTKTAAATVKQAPKKPAAKKSTSKKGKK